MNKYQVNIKESSSNLTARDRIKYKDTSIAISLDEATFEAEVIIDVKDYIVLDIHNEKNEERPDYLLMELIDRSGKVYKTSSEIFMNSFLDIYNEMESEDLLEELVIKVLRVPSKNFKGKDFLKPVLV